jgi:hypothetical protein
MDVKKTALLLATGCLTLGILAGVAGAIHAQAQAQQETPGTGRAVPAEKPPEYHQNFEHGYYELDYYEKQNP